MLLLLLLKEVFVVAGGEGTGNATGPRWNWRERERGGLLTTTTPTPPLLLFLLLPKILLMLGREPHKREKSNGEYRRYCYAVRRTGPRRSRPTRSTFGDARSRPKTLRRCRRHHPCCEP